MGGVPKDAGIVEGWIRSKTGVTIDEEIKSMMRRTMIESGTWRPDMTDEEMAEASKKVAQERETTGFKVDAEGGLYIESRQIKAALKESVNILYAGERWGVTRKGPKSFLAERVFVSPDELYLGRMEPDGVQLVIGHVVGPQGPRSTLGHHEYTTQSEIEFDVLSARDAIEEGWWVDLWVLAQENGIGALRSQGYGRFDLMMWEPVALETPSPRRSKT